MAKVHGGCRQEGWQTRFGSQQNWTIFYVLHEKLVLNVTDGRRALNASYHPPAGCCILFRDCERESTGEVITSTLEELKEKLKEYVDEVNMRKPGFIKVVRHSKQEGLIRSRVSGWRAATAPVVALFDAHVEFSVGWAEPVLTRIKENRKRVISPSFDNIKYDNFEIEEYPLSAQGFDWELWCRYLNPPKSWWKLENSTAPIRSPALIGCFIVDREYFQEIGLLDEGMEVYGGENVELGIRVWQCGGSVEVLPCSRIAHIERAHKPYTEDLTAHVRRNALRVAEVWMDEFKSHVYMAWNIPQEDSGIDIGDISERKALRKKLQCKTFRWYLVSVYPEMRMYSDTIAYGVLQNSLKSDLCLDQGPDTENIPIMYICHGMTPQERVSEVGSTELGSQGSCFGSKSSNVKHCSSDWHSGPEVRGEGGWKNTRFKMDSSSGDMITCPSLPTCWHTYTGSLTSKQSHLQPIVLDNGSHQDSKPPLMATL
ncbi:Putative polypeptide N-acetylgalactosaminyltransferase-like protein 4 [Chelonia mydas]|uniref:Polypeptide N-acetylgalactosaminyltransferase n=1 Tax=Chelonia mydas TaxID=8469 RepID=M7BG17_CHEMY|nr:Putative polypeptide N-acetylgalactosaminyltransferase-like protein 4 [Chelonia mydas]